MFVKAPWICLALCFLADHPLRAAEPQATFALKKGWLRFGVEQDGKAVDHVRIRVLDFDGQTLAEGDSGDSAGGEFPLPARPAYLVGITIPGKPKEADVVTLRSDGKAISPARVSLRFNKPCCRVTFSVAPESPADEPPQPERPPVAWLLLAVSGACMLVAGVMVVSFRRP